MVTVTGLVGQYWINAGKTALKTTAEVAGREEIINYTLPPDFIFSIWAVIYLGFLVYAFYGTLGAISVSLPLKIMGRDHHSLL